MKMPIYSEKLLNSPELLSLLQAAKLLTETQSRELIKRRTEIDRTLRRLSVEPLQTDADFQFPLLLDAVLRYPQLFPAADFPTLSEEQIFQAIAQASDVPFLHLDPLTIDSQHVTRFLSKPFSIRNLLMTFEMTATSLKVAMCNPFDVSVLDSIEKAAQLPLTVVVVTREDLQKVLGDVFGFQKSIEHAEDQFSAPEQSLTSAVSDLESFTRLATVSEANSEQHVTLALTYLFRYAMDQRASDIHIEPERADCQIRFRIDGLLHPIYQIPKVVQTALVSKLKAMSRLDIAEKRRPQDGRMRLSLKSSEATEVTVEIRLSTIPVTHGEKIVLRLLDETVGTTLDDAGLFPEDLTTLRRLIRLPSGIILLTGPTGSGKSTTLYTALEEIRSPATSIVTIEDPVERVVRGIGQVAVNPTLDITFASALRTILRQDPDIIMVGEIRDQETAKYAIQAALTGHLVFSTLHTNDSISSVARLEDLGVERYMIASTIRAIIAQRLVRRICPKCAQDEYIDSDVLRAAGFSHAASAQALSRGSGCLKCRQTGYFGRLGIFEIFEVTKPIRELLSSHQSLDAVTELATRYGMRFLEDDAWNKVLKKLTTYDEASTILQHG